MTVLVGDTTLIAVMSYLREAVRDALGDAAHQMEHLVVARACLDAAPRSVPRF